MSQQILLDRTPVSLPSHLAKVVTRMFSSAVLEKTAVDRITYWSDGLRVKGYLARPTMPGRYPVLIWNRGGSGEFGGLDDLTAYLILASTAVWGYTVLATQYRGNYGGDGVEDWGGEDINDALNLLPLAEELPECNADRVGIEGASRGGMTTYRALAKEHRFRCGIVHAGISDVVALTEEKPDFAKLARKLVGDLPETEFLAQMQRRSAVYFADQLPRTAPLLLLHGTADQKVPSAQSEALAAKLTELNIPHELVLLDGGKHVALKDGTYVEIDRHRKRWLNRHL